MDIGNLTKKDATLLIISSNLKKYADHGKKFVKLVNDELNKQVKEQYPDINGLPEIGLESERTTNSTYYLNMLHCETYPGIETRLNFNTILPDPNENDCDVKSFLTKYPYINPSLILPQYKDFMYTMNRNVEHALSSSDQFTFNKLEIVKTIIDRKEDFYYILTFSDQKGVQHSYVMENLQDVQDHLAKNFEQLKKIISQESTIKDIINKQLEKMSLNAECINIQIQAKSGKSIFYATFSVHGTEITVPISPCKDFNFSNLYQSYPNFLKNLFEELSQHQNDTFNVITNEYFDGKDPKWKMKITENKSKFINNFSLEEPIAEKYNLRAIYSFDSYKDRLVEKIRSYLESQNNISTKPVINVYMTKDGRIALIGLEPIFLKLPSGENLKYDDLRGEFVIENIQEASLLLMEAQYPGLPENELLKNSNNIWPSDKQKKHDPITTHANSIEADNRSGEANNNTKPVITQKISRFANIIRAIREIIDKYITNRLKKFFRKEETHIR